MKKKIIALIFLLCMLSLSCNSKNEPLGFDTSLKKSEVSIGHNNLVLNNMSFLNKIVGLDTLLTYDVNLEKLVLLDLKSKTPIYTIDIETQGPDFFDFPIFDIEIRKSKLYVLSKSYLSIFTLTGKNIQRYDSDDIKGMNSDFMITEFELITPSQILFNQIPLQAITGNFETSSPPYIFSLFDLNTRLLQELDIQSPKEALVNETDLGYYNDFAFHSMVFENDSIVYSFGFSSKVYVYDMKKKTTTVLPSPTKLTKSIREPTSPNVLKSSEWMKYTRSDPKFSPLVRDEKTGYYARVHSEFKERPDGKRYNFKYLMVFNSKLEMVSEIEIEERIIEPALFTNGKIYLKKTDQTQEDSFQFVVYEVIEN
tara:strand:+ start:1793 stop:2896 length:1104 start_codon:yes stop_codon:yes gene_type:complete